VFGAASAQRFADLDRGHPASQNLRNVAELRDVHQIVLAGALAPVVGQLIEERAKALPWQARPIAPFFRRS